MENEQTPIELQSKNEVLKYSLWSAGLVLLCLITTYNSWIGTSLENEWAMIFYGGAGNFVMYIIYAGVIWGISLRYGKTKTLKRFMKILTWIVILSSAYSFNHKREIDGKQSASIAPIKENKQKTYTAFYRELLDTCKFRLSMYKDTVFSNDVCECMVDKAKQTWTIDQLDTKDFLLIKGKGDTALKWINDCFGATGYMGHVGK
jgi:hypothetical protein